VPDMLVRLYAMPAACEAVQRLKQDGITIRRPQPYECSVVRRFIEKNFSETWADETMTAFSHQPVTAYIAVDGQRIVGFAAYECTRKDYFGPTGVLPEYRKRGIGLALLQMSLQGLADLGYAYAVIGGAGPVDFYAKAVGAEVIENSVPGIYTAPLPEEAQE